MSMFFQVLGVLSIVACASLSAICFMRKDYINATTFVVNTLTFILLTIMSRNI